MAIKRPFRQIFLDTIAAIPKDASGFVTNKALREELGWSEDRYRLMRWQLKEEGLLVGRRGQGGSVALALSPGAKALSVFVSYSHSDEMVKTELLKHLQPLKHQGLIEAWHDRKLVPGQEWGKEISAQLGAADLVLLLVSIDFINSPYCYELEMERAMERHDAAEAVVIPIIVRDCLWAQTPFAKLQALPKDAKAVSQWADRDHALRTVAEGVRGAAQDLLERR